jgi:hypothetical protein
MTRSNTTYFVPLITLPTIIDQPGEYLTRCGETVTVSVVSSKHDLGCLGEYSPDIREGWHKSGRLYASTQSKNDIVAKKAEQPNEHETFS